LVLTGDVRLFGPAFVERYTVRISDKRLSRFLKLFSNYYSEFNVLGGDNAAAGASSQSLRDKAKIIDAA
jgi:hypothetical protein